MRRILFLCLGFFVLSHAAIAQEKVEKPFVIHISVDGLRGDLLGKLMEKDERREFSAFKRLIEEGAGTLNARTDFTHTNTLPNHACMLTGRPVLQPEGQPDTIHHGLTLNSTPEEGKTLHNAGNIKLDYVASVFDVLHEKGLSAAIFASKKKFIIYSRSYPEKIARYHYESTEEMISTASSMHQTFMAEMKEKKFRYAFVHYRDPDSSGHEKGWGSEEWNHSMKRVNGYLEEILQLVDSEESFRGRTYIILTSDHGGYETDHEDAGRVEAYTIPFFVWGPDVAKGKDLYQLNTKTRKDPGTARPDYNEKLQPIRNGDSGNLALKLLGLGPVPGSTINAEQDLGVR